MYKRQIYGCTSTATVSVNVNPLVVSASASSTTVCAGISTTLTGVATGGGEPYTYDWSDGMSSVGTTAVLAVSPMTTTTYTFTVTDNCSTVLSATPVTITVNPAPGASVTPSTALYCAPTPVALSATSGDMLATFAWSPAAGLNVTTGANVNATPSAATTYTVTAIGANGCTSTATALVNVGTPINVTATADTIEGCSPFGTNLHACANPSPNNYVIGSPAYNLQSTAGFTSLTGADDADLATSVPLPFAFNFYGVAQTTINIGSNGYVYFGAPNGGSIPVSYTHLTLPNSDLV